MKKSKKRVDVYQVITDKIIAKLEKGIVPWQKPWNSNYDAPRNFITKNRYTGINSFHLATEGFVSPYWLTFKQAKEKGGNVKKGEHGSQIVYSSKFKIEVADKNTGEKQIVERYFLKLYTVFNAEQVEGIEFPEIERPSNQNFNPVKEAEKILANMPKTMPEIQHVGNRACYSPSMDLIKMPQKTVFVDESKYYSTLFHELTHATGHQSRLNRKELTGTHNFGTHDYSKEELTAEMGAAFLCGESGLLNRTINNTTAYIQSWLKRLKNDNKLVIQAASKASQSTKYILGGENTK